VLSQTWEKVGRKPPHTRKNKRGIIDTYMRANPRPRSRGFPTKRRPFRTSNPIIKQRSRKLFSLFFFRKSKGQKHLQSEIVTRSPKHSQVAMRTPSTGDVISRHNVPFFVCLVDAFVYGYGVSPPSIERKGRLSLRSTSSVASFNVLSTCSTEGRRIPLNRALYS